MSTSINREKKESINVLIDINALSILVDKAAGLPRDPEGYNSYIESRLRGKLEALKELNEVTGANNKIEIQYTKGAVYGEY